MHSVSVKLLFQVAGNNYIVGEFPGLENISQVIAVIKQTGMLEFVDMGANPLAPGTEIQTDYQAGSQSSTAAVTPTPAPLNVGQPQVNPAQPQATTAYHTVITGADLNSVVVYSSTKSRRWLFSCIYLKTGGETGFWRFYQSKRWKIFSDRIG